jgi:uncharacterized protein (TIGR03437 family)
MICKTRCKLLVRPASFILVALAAMPPLSAAPAIMSVMNAASNIPPGLPNAAIALGSIFIVKGSGLGPANISVAPAAFQSTSLSGTSVTITVGATTVSALMYYTSDTQVAALLPSNTPFGPVRTITVTYNGQTSAPVPLDTIANNPGIFTVDSSGQGPALITFPDYSLVSPAKATNCGGPNTTCGAANPGDTLILWATGLGPASGSDASGAGLGQNMPNVPLTVWLGGVQAPVIYQGRSGCCIGVDQIVFTVPNDVPTGCAVPLVVQINARSTPPVTFNEISNNVMMPIATGSRDCTPVDAVLKSVGLAKLQQTIAAGSFNLGAIELDHFLNDGGAGFHDVAQINFIKSTKSPVPPLFAATAFDSQPLGTCIATPRFGGGDNGLGILTPLDGGSSFTIKGPGGTMTVTANTGDRSVLSAAGTFLVPGDYTITGTGGKDVGPFTANFNIPVSPTLTNPRSSTGLTVSRGQDMTVTWNGNGSTGHVELVLVSAVNDNTRARVTCTAPASAGTFAIPSYMLLTLPNTGNGFFAFQLGDQGPASSLSFSAPGLDVGLAQTFIDGASFGGFSITN